MKGSPTNQECEIKLLLSGDEYDRLHADLPNPLSEVRQHNLFLDTKDRQLSARRWALRLRREERPDEASRLIATVKGPTTRVAGAARRIEVEAPADDTLWPSARQGDLAPESIGGPVGDYLRRELGLRSSLFPVLAFTNQRTTFELMLDGVARLVELDRTQYATGEIDHELELELELDSAPDAPDAPLSEAMATLEIHSVFVLLSNVLAAHGIEAKRSSSGKFSRGLRYAADSVERV